MISANEARALFIQPPYVIEDIETAIKAKATYGNYTCFAANRWSDQLSTALLALGYNVVINSIGDVIVSWDQETRCKECGATDGCIHA